MTVILLVATVLMTLHASNSYILLTANLEDVHAIAKQLAESPVADQVKKIWRRAANHFNQYVVKSKQQPQLRTNDMESISKEQQQVRADEEVSNVYYSDGIGRGQPEGGDRRNDEFGATIKNASYYLSSIKKIMESI